MGYAGHACGGGRTADLQNPIAGVSSMNGIFGAYTSWAIVFLIIFVLFFLFVPAGA